MTPTMPYSGRSSAASPRVLHRAREFPGRQRVEHVILRQPGTASLQDAVTNLLHVRRVMRVSIDDDLYAVLFGLAKMNIIEVEAVGIGVQFHRHFVLGCGSEHRVHVEAI